MQDLIEEEGSCRKKREGLRQVFCAPKQLWTADSLPAPDREPQLTDGDEAAGSFKQGRGWSSFLALLLSRQALASPAAASAGTGQRTRAARRFLPSRHFGVGQGDGRCELKSRTDEVGRVTGPPSA